MQRDTPFLDPPHGDIGFSSSPNSSLVDKTPRAPSQLRYQGDSTISDIFWKSDSQSNFVYSQQFQPPYIVIIEPKTQGRNLGRYDPIAIGKLVAEFIEGERTIYISGRNQIKVFYENLVDANILLPSLDMIDRCYR